VRVGSVPDPLNWDRIAEARALLEPARAIGGFESTLEPDEVLFVVLDGDELSAAATAWLSTDRFVEIKLVGGRDHRRWIVRLDEAVGRAAAEAGATRLVAWGRRGWTKTLRELGWDSFAIDAETNGYSRSLIV
jgi:hypothetical protein